MNDIRSMQKDIARLSQEELEKKQKEVPKEPLLAGEEPFIEPPGEEAAPEEKNASPSPPSIAQIEPEIPKIFPEEIPASPTEKSTLPLAASAKKTPLPFKVIGFALVLIFLFLISTFSYWLFFVKEKSREKPAVPSKNEIVVPPKETSPEKIPPEKSALPEAPEPSLPVSLIPVSKDILVKISSPEQLLSQVENLIKTTSLVPGEFTRVLIKFETQDKKEYLNFFQFLDSMGVPAPENVLSRLAPDYTLFLRPQKEGNRFGFVVKIKEKNGLEETMRSWETTMEEDWKPIFAIYGKNPRDPGFLQDLWGNILIRYRVYEPGLGPNYAILENQNFLIFTISGDSIHAVIRTARNMEKSGSAAEEPLIFYKNGSRNEPKVALTFDDGPNSEWTPKILETLERFGVHATFFLIGKQAEKYPGIVKEIQTKGNPIGNHGYFHSRNSEDFERADAVFKNILGQSPEFLRPPYADLDLVANSSFAQTKKVVNFDVSTGDWDNPGTEKIIERALSATKNGSIVLLHDGGGEDRSQTVQALPEIIKTLSQNFQFVGIGELNLEPSYQQHDP